MFTAFVSTRHPVTARLIVRRVRDRARLDELFPVWRHHPFLTDSLEPAPAADIASQLEQAKTLGDLPLTVLTAGTGSLDGWHQLHEELAAMSSRGSHTSVAEATHVSLVTDREHSRATVDAVRATLTAAETQQRG